MNQTEVLKVITYVVGGIGAAFVALTVGTAITHWRAILKAEKIRAFKKLHVTDDHNDSNTAPVEYAGSHR